MILVLLHALMLQNVHHQYRNLGGWTFAFEDYYDLNLTAHFDDPQVSTMANIIDPYGKMSSLYSGENYYSQPTLSLVYGCCSIQGETDNAQDDGLCRRG